MYTILALVATLGAIMAPVVMAAGDPMDGAISVDDNSIRLNQLQLLGTHNSYKKFPRKDIYVC